jgi:hypothetical protein
VDEAVVATVTATYEGMTATASVTVEPPPEVTLESIALAPADATVSEGDAVTYGLTATYSDGSTAPVTPDAISVDPESAGAFVGSVFTAGTVDEAVVATVTATYDGMTATATVTVNPPAPPEPASLDLDPAEDDQGVATATGVSAGDAIPVEVYIRDAVDMAGFDVHMTFDPTAVEVVPIGFLQPPGRSDLPGAVTENMEVGDGTLTLSVGTFPPITTPGNGFSGDGLLCILNFNVLGGFAEESEIALTSVVVKHPDPGAPKDYLYPTDVGVTLMAGVVEPPVLESIALTPANVTLDPGDVQTYTLTATYSDGSQKAKAPDSITVDPETAGTFVGSEFRAGAVEETVVATVTATYEGLTATATVTVTVGPVREVASLTLTPDVSQVWLPSVDGGDELDGSRGERTFEAVAADEVGLPVGGVTVTWVVENTGDVEAWVVGGGLVPDVELPAPVPAGESLTIETVADADGQASITLDSDPLPEGALSSTVRITASVDGFTESVMLSWQRATPVELASFKGSLSKEGIVLWWAAASQTNNYGWDIYRSVDGTDFAKIGFVKGAGTTVDLLSYAFTDSGLPSGKVARYYLRQINTDGTAGDSPTISVNLPSTAVRGENWGELKSQFR